jgi:hypothetical protein
MPNNQQRLWPLRVKKKYLLWRDAGLTICDPVIGART